MKRILLFNCFVLISFFGLAQTVEWDFEGDSNVASVVPADIFADKVAFGSGVGDINFFSGNGSADAYSANDWSTGSSPDADDYIEFCMTNLTGADIFVTSFDFEERRSGTGPTEFTVDYSVDGAAFTNLGSGSIPDNTSWRSHSFAGPITVGASDNICFRVFGFGAEASTGTWRFDNVVITYSTVLPVEFGKIETRKNNKNIFIDWETYSEINNDYFSIEWSKDGRSFESLGIVTGAGNSSEKIRYNYTHKNPLNGINYYRIKQVDYDGAFAYSEIVTERMDSEKVGISLYPSPVQNDLNVSVDEIENFTVYTLSGQRVMELRNLTSGRISLSELNSGIYVVKVKTADSTYSQKLIKL